MGLIKTISALNGDLQPCTVSVEGHEKRKKDKWLKQHKGRKHLADPEKVWKQLENAHEQNQDFLASQGEKEEKKEEAKEPKADKKD